VLLRKTRSKVPMSGPPWRIGPEHARAEWLPPDAFVTGTPKNSASSRR
jgi:hypothetical protein